MNTLDRYIVRNFLISVFLCFAVLMAMRIVVDLSVNLDEFTKIREQQQVRTAGQIMGDIAVFYGVHSLLYLRELGSVIIALGAAFTLWRMNRTNELTAILASGVSLYRVLLPIVLCAIGLNLLLVLDSEVLIPRCKYLLARSRDDPVGAETFTVRLATDAGETAWFSKEYQPTQSRLLAPLAILRDKDFSYLGHISAGEAVFRPEEGAWTFQAAPVKPDGPPREATFFPGGTRRLDAGGERKALPTARFIPTHLGPAAFIELAKKLPGNRNVNWDKPPNILAPEVNDTANGMRIRARRLLLREKDGTPSRPTLEQPRFEYLSPDGNTLATFLAESAVYENADPQRLGWTLHQGRLTCASDLTPGDLTLRQSSNWLSYMSSSELSSLLQLERVPDIQNAMLVRHCRFADFLNSLIILLASAPFILSRERNIKASAGLTVLMGGAVYVFIYVARYVGLSPALAAWLPILVFGPVAAYMLDSVKT